MRICLGTALISLTACQPDMDFTNPSADSEANYYNTKEHLTYAVNGAYNMLQRGGGWARWMPFMLNARSDEYVFTSGAQAGEPETARLAMYTANADLGSLSATYQDLYTMQYAANLALEKLEINQDGAFDLNNTEDKALYDRLRGEAIFLRGLSRFYLVYFGVMRFLTAAMLLRPMGAITCCPLPLLVKFTKTWYRTSRMQPLCYRGSTPIPMIMVVPPEALPLLS